MSSQGTGLLFTIRAVAITAILLLGGGFPSAAQTPEEANIIGTWRVTQEPGTSSEFFVYAVVGEGGVLSTSDMDFSVGSGVWRKNGPGNFAATVEEFAGSASDGRANSRIV
jgi:hypothetical protein